jgi:hypothetical protein
MKATLAVAVVVISVGAGGCGPGGAKSKCPEVSLSEGSTAEVTATEGTLSTRTVSAAYDTVHKPAATNCVTVMAADTVRKP